MRRTIPEHLLRQSIAYISIGVFLTISHFFDDYFVVGYFGYILISLSFILMVSTIIYEFSDATWISRELHLFFRHLTRRIAVELDRLFVRIIPLLSIAILLFTILNEVIYEDRLKEEDATISTIQQSNIEVVSIIVIIGLILYLGAQILPLFIRRRQFGILFLVQMIPFIVLTSLKVATIFVVLYLLAVIMVSLVFTMRRNVRRRIWHDVNQATPRVFSLMSLVLFVAGIPAAFSEVYSVNDFWGLALCFTCFSVSFELRLPVWRQAFPFSVRVMFKLGLLILLAGILYIWAIAFNPEAYWAFGTWIICAVVTLSSEGKEIFRKSKNTTY